MNTIVSTTKKTNYTVIGGKREGSLRKTPPTLSIVLLNRAGRVFKNEVIHKLKNLDIHEIISIESDGAGYDVESLSTKHPSVKFIRIHEKITEGEKINIGIKETESKFAFVMYDDMTILAGGFSNKLKEQIEAIGDICIVPLLQTKDNSIIPSMVNPAYRKRTLETIHLRPSDSGAFSLFPFDYCGVYEKSLFMKVGGFDNNILNNWWQKMDFGFRCYMWGEKIQCKTSLIVKYLDDIPEESQRLDKSYRFFYLKNLAVKLTNHFGMIPKSKFFMYYLKSKEGIFQARREFNAINNWVEQNKNHFTLEAKELVETWEGP